MSTAELLPPLPPASTAIGTPTNTVEGKTIPTIQPAENGSPSSSPASTGESAPQPTAAPVAQCADVILTFNLEDGQKGYVRRRLDNGTYSIVAPVAEGNGVYQIMRPSDPTNPLAVISVMTDNGRPSVAANVLVNVATGAFKVLGTEYRDNPKYIAAWLQLERLAWIDDQGAAYTGSIQAQQSLNAPARMTDLWFVPSDRFLMRDDAGQFWTYERSGEMWYPALNPEENAKIDQRWFETAAVFEDIRHVFLFFQE